MGEEVEATIMMPAYNAERFIGEALESALHQTYSRDYEVLVVNDGSIDDTQGILEWYEKKNSDRMRVTNQENQGLGAARNRLFDESRGEILFGLDADDVLHSDALKRVINYFEENQNAGFVYTDQRDIDEDGNELMTRKRMNYHKFFQDLIYHALCAGHLRSYRREFIGGYRFDRDLRSGEDWDLTLRMMDSMQILHLPEVLYDYRINRRGVTLAKKAEVVDSSISLISGHLERAGRHCGKDFEIAPVELRNGLVYYDHLVDGESTMQPDTRLVLEKYLLEGI